MARRKPAPPWRNPRGVYRSGLRDHAGRPWSPPLALRGHSFGYGARTVQRPTDPAAQCGTCFAVLAWWQLAEGFAPLCMGSVAALPAPPTQLAFALG